jgi:hypothetical protein
MPLSDDRYLRDLRRYNLALTFFRFAARPNTVQAWTGFSRQRVRVIFRNYLENRSNTDPRCSRGPNPTKLANLLSNPTLRRELTVMAGVCRLLHLTPEECVPNARAVLPSVANGERLCHALGLYYRMVPHARLTLEHVILLVFELAEGSNWRLERCSGCRVVMLADRSSVGRQLCAECRQPKHPPRVSADHEADGPLSVAGGDSPESAGGQQSLF